MGAEQRPAACTGGGSRWGPADGLDAILEEASDAHLRARSAAAKVPIGFVLGAEVDAVGRAVERFERTSDPTADLERARALLDRATRVAVEARRQQRRSRQRTTSALAAMTLGRAR